MSEINNIIRIACETSGLDKFQVIGKLVNDVQGAMAKWAPSIYQGQKAIDSYNNSFLKQAEILNKLGGSYKAYNEIQRAAIKSEEQLVDRMRNITVQSSNMLHRMKAQREEIQRLAGALSGTNNQNFQNVVSQDVRAYNASVKQTMEEIIKNNNVTRVDTVKKINDHLQSLSIKPLFNQGSMGEIGELGALRELISSMKGQKGVKGLSDLEKSLVASVDRVNQANQTIQGIINTPHLMAGGGKLSSSGPSGRETKLPGSIISLIGNYVGRGFDEKTGVIDLSRKIFQDLRNQPTQISDAIFSKNDIAQLQKEFGITQGSIKGSSVSSLMKELMNEFRQQKLNYLLKMHNESQEMYQMMQFEDKSIKEQIALTKQAIIQNRRYAGTAGGPENIVGSVVGDPNRKLSKEELSSLKNDLLNNYSSRVVDRNTRNATIRRIRFAPNRRHMFDKDVELLNERQAPRTQEYLNKVFGARSESLSRQFPFYLNTTQDNNYIPVSRIRQEVHKIAQELGIRLKDPDIYDPKENKGNNWTTKKYTGYTLYNFTNEQYENDLNNIRSTIGLENEQIRKRKESYDQLRKEQILRGEISKEDMTRQEKIGLRREQSKEWSNEMGWMVKRHLEWVATGAVLYGVADAFKRAFEAESQFEKGLTRVASITAHGRDQMQLLKKGILDMDKSVFSSAQTAETMYHIVSTGLGQSKDGYLDVAASIKNAENANKLATLGMYDSSEAAVHLAVIMKQFNMGADESQRVLDGLSYAAAKSATEIPKLAEAMKYAGVVANESGLGFEDTLGMMMKLADAGIRGTDMGERLRGVIKRLADPSKEAQKAFKDMGIEMMNEDGSAVSLYDKLNRLKEGLSKLPTGKQEKYLGDIFEQRTSAAGRILMRYTKADFDEAINKQKAMNDGQRQFEVMTNNIIDQWKILSNEMGKFGIEIAEPLVKDIGKIAKAGIDLFTGLKQAAQGSPGIGGVVTGGVESIVAMGGSAALWSMGGWAKNKILGQDETIYNFLKRPGYGYSGGFNPGNSNIYPSTLLPGAGSRMFGVGALAGIGAAAYTGDAGAGAKIGIASGLLTVLNPAVGISVGIIASAALKWYKDNQDKLEEDLKQKIAQSNVSKRAFETSIGYIGGGEFYRDLYKSTGDQNAGKSISTIPNITRKYIERMIAPVENTTSVFDPDINKLKNILILYEKYKMSISNYQEENVAEKELRQLINLKKVISIGLTDRIESQRSRFKFEIEKLNNYDTNPLEYDDSVKKGWGHILTSLGFYGDLGMAPKTDPQKSFDESKNVREELKDKWKHKLQFLTPERMNTLMSKTDEIFKDVASVSGPEREKKLQEWSKLLKTLFGEPFATEMEPLSNEIIGLAKKSIDQAEDAVEKYKKLVSGQESYLNLFGDDLETNKKILMKHRKLTASLLLAEKQGIPSLDIGVMSVAGLYDIIDTRTGYSKKYNKLSGKLSNVPDWKDLNTSSWFTSNIQSGSGFNLEYSSQNNKYRRQFDNIRKRRFEVDEFNKSSNEQIDKVSKQLYRDLKNYGAYDSVKIFSGPKVIEELTRKYEKDATSITKEETQILSLSQKKKQLEKQRIDINKKFSIERIESLHNMALEMNNDIENSRNTLDSDISQLFPSYENKKKSIKDSTKKQLDWFNILNKDINDSLNIAKDAKLKEKDPEKIKVLDAAIKTFQKELKLIPGLIKDLNLTETAKLFMIETSRMLELKQYRSIISSIGLRLSGRGPEADHISSLGSLQNTYETSRRQAYNEKDTNKLKMLAVEYYYNLRELNHTFSKQKIDEENNLKELKARNIIEEYRLRGQYADAEYKSKTIQNQKSFDDEMFTAKDNLIKQNEIRKFYARAFGQDYKVYISNLQSETNTLNASAVATRLRLIGKTLRADIIETVMQIRADKDRILSSLDPESDAYKKNKKIYEGKEELAVKDHKERIYAIQYAIETATKQLNAKLSGRYLYGEHYKNIREIISSGYQQVQNAGGPDTPMGKEAAANVKNELELEARRFKEEYSKVYNDMYMSIMQNRFALTKQEISAEYNLQYHSLKNEYNDRMRLHYGDIELRLLIEKDFSTKVYMLWKSIYARIYDTRFKSMQEGMGIFVSTSQSYAQRTGQDQRGSLVGSRFGLYTSKYKAMNDPSIDPWMRPFYYAQIKEEEDRIAIQERQMGVGGERETRLRNNLKILESKKLKTSRDFEQIKLYRSELGKIQSGGSGQVLSGDEQKRVKGWIDYLPYMKNQIAEKQDKIDERHKFLFNWQRSMVERGVGANSPEGQAYAKQIQIYNRMKSDRDRVNGPDSDMTRGIAELKKLALRADSKTQDIIAKLIAELSMKTEKIQSVSIDAITGSAKADLEEMMKKYDIGKFNVDEYFKKYLQDWAKDNGIRLKGDENKQEEVKPQEHPLKNSGPDIYHIDASIYLDGEKIAEQIAKAEINKINKYCQDQDKRKNAVSGGAK